MSSPAKAAKMRFRRKAIPGFRESREPTAGDLRFPISIYRSARTPQPDGSFSQTLTAYHSGFSAFDSAPERYLHGENADHTSTHLFTIRWDQSMQIEARDYVEWKNRFYRVVFTKVIGRMRDWLAIFCIEHFENDGNVNIAPVKTTPTQEDRDQTNAGWGLPSA